MTTDHINLLLSVIIITLGAAMAQWLKQFQVKLPFRLVTSGRLSRQNYSHTSEKFTSPVGTGHVWILECGSTWLRLQSWL